MGANLRRNAKSGHDWTNNDFEAYNISISAGYRYVLRSGYPPSSVSSFRSPQLIDDRRLPTSAS